MTDNESWRNVGKRIRLLRKENRLTLKQLAIGCDLSPNAISLVERGEVAPTVMTLCKIAHALGVSASSLFQEICSTEVILTRAGGEGQTQARSDRAFQFLSGRGAALPYFSAGGTACGLSAPMNQMVLCVCGPIEYEVDEQCYRLNPGDSLAFNGNAYHRWRNSGAETGVAVMVITRQQILDDPGG